MTAIEDAVNIVMHERLCAHEAGHAAAALLGGLDVREVRADFHDLTAPPADPDQPAGYVDMAVDRDNPAELREQAIAIMAGPICDNRPSWPPRWPLLAPVTDDERQLTRLVDTLGLDEKGYGQLVHDAYARTTSREFHRLHMGVTELLEHGYVLDAATLSEVAEATGTKDGDLEQVRRKACADMVALDTALKAEKALSRKSTQPIEVATFEC